jgi:hypothetical protein
MNLSRTPEVLWWHFRSTAEAISSQSLLLMASFGAIFDDLVQGFVDDFDQKLALSLQWWSLQALVSEMDLLKREHQPVYLMLLQ